MKRKIMLMGIVFILIIESVFVYNIFKPNKSQILEDIKTVDIFDNKDKTLSIMVQDPTTFEYKSDTSRTTWPQKTEYMYAGTKCTDASGKDVGDTTPYISFKETSPNPTVTITTKKTIYCTLYFAKGRPALEVLKAKGGDYYAGGGQHTTIVDGMYRFKGTASQVDNNYICLGDENPDVCKTNSENMYRIIGVTTDGKLKVIKAKKYGANRGWFSITKEGIWSSSELYTFLNGTFYNSIDARIKGSIDNYTWKMEQTTSTPGTTTGSQDGTVQNHIGLMYGSDYVNAYKNNSTDNWLFITNGWTRSAAEEEWTMSRSQPPAFYYAWCIDNVNIKM